jgi:hypothetical protein
MSRPTPAPTPYAGAPASTEASSTVAVTRIVSEKFMIEGLKIAGAKELS